jgi:hypothetical protein
MSHKRLQQTLAYDEDTRVRRLLKAGINVTQWTAGIFFLFPGKQKQ